MNNKVMCITISYLALASAGLIAGPSANILEGPSTRTKIVGPDGSIIDAYAPGGKIVLGDNAGPLLQTAPVVVAQSAIAEPQFYSVPDVPAVIETIEPAQQIIISSNQVAANVAPFSEDRLIVARVSEDEQKVLLQPEIALKVENRVSVPIMEETEETSTATTEINTTEDIETSTSDLSGEYVQDNLEKLYDDGSYRSEHF